MMTMKLRSPKRCRHRRRRSGTTVVECAVVLSVWLLVVFATFDLTLATFRYNTLSEAARRVARQAVVRGSMSEVEAESWGPEPYLGNAADDDPIAEMARTILPTMDPADVTISLEWLDAGNEPDHRVRVNLQYVHQPLIPFQAFANEFALRGDSVMRISH